MKTPKVNKGSKNTTARKNAEAQKAKKKDLRDVKSKNAPAPGAKGKGKSVVPQSKKK